ncbi:MAG: dihydrodipicolinate synthase family protein, partial [Verrucomicrobiales bacterium]
MQTSPITKKDIASSVIAVPPLARNVDLSLNRDENAALVRHLESGGVTTLLYGGNANLYHLRLSEYAELLAMLEEIAAERTLVIPSIGPAFGTMMDQVKILRDHAYPTVMVLPQVSLTTPGGVETGIRRAVEVLEKPVVLYMKQDGYFELEGIRRLC